MSQYIKTECGYEKKIGNPGVGYGAEIFNNGDSAKASGNYSHAEGYGTTASGTNSHAEGCGTYAYGDSSHAEGCGTYAYGDSSHVEGYHTSAVGRRAHAEGTSTHAHGPDQHVQGRHNVPSDNLAHIVGNGTVGNNSNAHVLDWSGNAWFAGDVYVGSTSGKDKDEGSKRLATEDYVDGRIQEDGVIIKSSTPDSTKKFKLTVDDSGAISVTEVVE